MAHEEAPAAAAAAACNMGTHHAHEMAVPQFNGKGTEIKAHDNIPGEEHGGECVHEAHE
ncbi:MAG: hypothetical protein HYS09_06035 [Chloroflexi bacterium]|nr:hypothetical protein [Chloroflexota bacterium]